MRANRPKARRGAACRITGRSDAAGTATAAGAAAGFGGRPSTWQNGIDT